MGATALWTAVHYNIPLLVVVANNRSFFNDELHQERVARMRNRPVENRWIGQRIADPEIDIAQLARAQGALGFGPITDGADLAGTFHEAIEAVAGGAVAVVDVRVAPGYAPAAVAGTVPHVTVCWFASFRHASPERGVAFRCDRCHARACNRGLSSRRRAPAIHTLTTARRRNLRCSSTSMTSRLWKPR